MNFSPMQDAVEVNAEVIDICSAHADNGDDAVTLEVEDNGTNRAENLGKIFNHGSPPSRPATASGCTRVVLCRRDGARSRSESAGSARRMLPIDDAAARASISFD